jgi:hypothetical protein
MHRTPAFELRTTDDGLVLDIGAEQWRLLFANVRRINPDWLVHVVALGPRVCAFTLRVDARPGEVANARRIVRAIAEWLQTGDPRQNVYLEVAQSRRAHTCRR